MSTSPNLRPAILRLISEFRGFENLVTSEVKMSELELQDGVYVVKGAYHYHSFLGTPLERGSFEIRLKQDDLSPTKIKIVPLGR